MKPFLIYLVLVNAIAWVVMLSDKRKAQKRSWRIPEATLFCLAAIGGSLGIWVGMCMFHHKTRKPKFRIGIPLILVLQAAISCWIFFLVR